MTSHIIFPFRFSGFTTKAFYSRLLASVFPLLLIGLMACMSYSRIIVTDFDRTIKLKVENKSSKDGIVRLKLRLISNIDQPIKMALKCDDQMVREIMLQTGDTKTILVDWYTNHAEIVFLDKTPKSGSIEIRYEFIEI